MAISYQIILKLFQSFVKFYKISSWWVGVARSKAENIDLRFEIWVKIEVKLIKKFAISVWTSGRYFEWD